MLAHAAILAVAAAVAAASQSTDRSLGALVDCPAARSADTRCLWAGEKGEVVDSHKLRELLIERNYVAYSDREAYRRNLQEHMTYIEGKRESILLFELAVKCSHRELHRSGRREYVRENYWPRVLVSHGRE